MMLGSVYRGVAVCVYVAGSAILVGCSTTISDSYMYYQRFGAFFVSPAQAEQKFTEVTIDCRRNVNWRFWLIVDDAVVARISPVVRDELRLEQCGFEKEGDLYRLVFEGGFAEVRMSGQQVVSMALRKTFADKGPRICVEITRSMSRDGLPMKISVPADADGILSALGEPDAEGNVMDSK